MKSVLVDCNKQYKDALDAFRKKNIKMAHAISVSIVKQYPNYTDAYYLLALINIQIHQYNKAAELLKNAININDIPKYRVELARTYALLGISDAVIAIGNTVNLENLKSSSELDTLGVTYSLVGLHQRALRCFELAIQKHRTPELLYNFAVSAKFCGKLNEAYKALTQALILKPEYYQAHFAISELTKGSDIEEHIKILTNQLKVEKKSVEAVMHLSHALAKEYDKKKNYTKSIETLLTAKNKRALINPYDRKLDHTLFENLRQMIENQLPTSSNKSQRPIFVVGMPRSGTTLVERILSGHSNVASGGELEDFGLLLKWASKSSGNSVLDASMFTSLDNIDFTELAKAYLSRTAHICGKRNHFVDKLPFNFFYLPFIRAAFPNAKIISLVRNPLDTCIGNFRQLFSLNNPHYKYTQTLTDCAWFYQQFLSWINAWGEYDKQLTKIINYENLTSDPQKQVRELLTFCDLEWESSCLTIETNSAPVSTASKMQVREPINQSSIGRWKRYRPYTDEIEELFSNS